MAQGKVLSLQVLHNALWRLRDRHDAVKVHQGELAAEFGVNKFTMSRKIRALVDEGRIRHVSNRRTLAGRFVVEDPADFASDVNDLHYDDPFVP